MLCQSCNNDWSKAPSGGCYKCKEGSTGHLTILAVLALVAFVVAYCGLSKHLARKRAKSEKSNASAGLLFDCLDSDRSGSISREELRTGLAELGMPLSSEETFLLMESIDMDGNGDVDRDEFEACASCTCALHTRRQRYDDSIIYSCGYGSADKIDLQGWHTKFRSLSN